MWAGIGDAHCAVSMSALGRGMEKESKHKSVTRLGREREIEVHAPGDSERVTWCLRDAAQESRSEVLRTKKIKSHLLSCKTPTNHPLGKQEEKGKGICKGEGENRNLMHSCPSALELEDRTPLAAGACTFPALYFSCYL